MINNHINKENGRALHLKYKIENEKDQSLLVRSVYYNYHLAYNSAAFVLDELTED